MQVFFGRLVIPRFRLIARSTRGTVLADLCTRLTVDDGIHHGAGVAYERLLPEHAPRRTKQKLADGLDRILPTVVDHMLWRPPERERIAPVMRVDVSGVHIPVD
jgi:hypothetical protein